MNRTFASLFRLSNMGDVIVAHRTPLQIAVAVLVLSLILAACEPNCGDDPQYRYDPETRTCIDLAAIDEIDIARFEQEYQDYLMDKSAYQDYLRSKAGEANQDSPDSASGEVFWYEVKPGDTLGEISAAYGVSVIVIAQANHISNPNLISVGQKLLIPSVSPSVLPTPPPPSANTSVGCVIKGNISFDTKERIYHIPGCEYYEQTEISPQNGERWFCTEAEAIANGWRKAKNCP
ncbi:MAG: LysM domain-containing protein [Chloroflexi bacterium]|nr:LysM domain-containing protein [Chloroflexota bacterium]